MDYWIYIKNSLLQKNKTKIPHNNDFTDVVCLLLVAHTVPLDLSYSSVKLHQ